VQIDYPARRVRFFDPRTYRHPTEGALIRFGFYERFPLVEAELVAPDRSRVTGHFEIDTGCNCEVMVGGVFAAEHRLQARYPEQLGDNPRFALRRGGKLVLGPLAFDRPTLALALTTDDDLIAPLDSAGMIGGRLLSRYQVTFDYPHKRLWLD
jgi:hypothetical protein